MMNKAIFSLLLVLVVTVGVIWMTIVLVKRFLISKKNK